MEKWPGIINLLSLSFKTKRVEKAFRDYYYQANLNHGRMCHVLTIFFFVADSVRDLFLFPQGLPGVFFIRYGVIVPLFSAGLILSYVKPGIYQKIWQPLFAIYFLVTGVCAIALTILTPHPVGRWLYIGIIYCLIFGYTFIRLRFWIAIFMGILVTAGYFYTAIAILKIETDLLWIQLPFVIGINILGIFVAYTVEYHFRKAFFLHELNNEQKEQLDIVNLNLENEVNKRTLELEVSNRMLKAKIDALHASEAEKNKLELQLRQAYKLEAIGTLAGGIAHDFNNILSGIFGYSQLAVMNINDPAKAKKHIDQVLIGAQRAAVLVQQILTFSRQTEQKKQPFKVFILLKEAVKLLRSSIPTTIEIKENINSKATILADPTQIHQVIMNLCTNAYHAMSKSGGILTIGLCDVEFSEKEMIPGINMQAGKYLKLEVSDTGHGMNRATQERIFDPYFTTKGIGKGTGLGLATVDGIVSNHDGFIKLFSEVGCGSTFQVFFPIIEQDDIPVLSETNKIDQHKGNEHILLVDDEVSILEPLQAILEKQGYTITAFKDGLSALNAFTNDPDKFDLILTDMTMPRMTGAELAVNVLKIRKQMPIILCTGYHETFNENSASEVGICRYVQKPIPTQMLSAMIREVLEEKKHKLKSPKSTF